MSRRDDALRRQLATLKESEPEQAVDVFVRALGGAPPVVSRAAERIAACAASGFGPALVRAFDQAMQDPVGSDPGCRVKVAVVGALLATRHLDPDPYLRGVRHVQREKMGPGAPVDTATVLRGACAMGLVSVAWPDTPLVLADLLCDPEERARVGAVAAIGAWGEPRWGTALLRVRLGSGERDGDVLSEAFRVALSLDGDGNLPWVVEALFCGHDVSEECAALALGESRHPEALGPLSRWAEARPRLADRRVALVCMGLLRSEAAVEELLRWVAKGSEPEVKAAIDALALYVHDPRMAAQIREAVQAAGHASLLGAEWEP